MIRISAASRIALPVVITAALLAGTSSGFAEILVEREPNDTAAQAQPILSPVSIGGAIGAPGDRDLFALRARAGQTIQADVLARGFRAGTNPGSALTARLRVLDSDGATILAEDLSAGSFDDPSVEAFVPADGVYYVSVEDLTGTGSASHIFVLSIEVEGNGSFDTATPVVPPALVSIDALIWPAGDHDFYQFEGKAGQIVTVDVDSAVFDPDIPPIKAVLTLYSPARAPIATDAYSTSDPNDPYIQASLPVDGTYYVEVRELRSFVGNSGAYYQLGVELGPSAGNDTVPSAMPITIDRGISGTICPAGDRDNASFSVPAATSLRADLDARSGLLSLLRGTLSLWTSAGSLVASNASSPDPLLVPAVGAGGYAVRVEGPSDGLCEDAYYKLWIDADVDGDGVRLPADVCPAVADPGQTDLDHDGVGDACDVCAAVFNPGQEGDLRSQDPVGDTVAMSLIGGSMTLTWTAAPGSFASNVYRASLGTAHMQPTFACIADNVSAEALVDPAVPPQGGAFAYVITGENCGESDAGPDSSGNPRKIARCPIPI